MPRLAQARRGGGLEVDIAHEQLCAELPRAGDRLTGVVDHTRVPIEQEFILAADETAEGDAGEVVARPLREHALALQALARVVGGRRDVHDQGRSRERLLGGGGTRLPDVLAHGQADPLGADINHGAGRAGLEVALLIEDAVVGQVHLAIDRVHRPAGQHGRRVVHVLRPLRKAHDRDHVARLRG